MVFSITWSTLGKSPTASTTHFESSFRFRSKASWKVPLPLRCYSNVDRKSGCNHLKVSAAMRMWNETSAILQRLTSRNAFQCTLTVLFLGAPSIESVLRSNRGISRIFCHNNDVNVPDDRTSSSVFIDEGFLRQAALATDADSVLAMISVNCGNNPGVITQEDCCRLVQSALAEGNDDLAFSVLQAMRRSQVQRRVGNVAGSQWPQPDIRIYITLIKSLAAALQVTDAIQAIGDVKRRGIPVGEEVPFGKVVKCPTCSTALAVVQPHHGVQLVPCSKCRYQYELISGDVVTCESESISMNISTFERTLRALQLKKQPLSSAVHSFVIKSPDGMARTYRFGTASVDVPAQLGERITVAAAAPANSSRGLGPFKVNARAPGWRPSEPMSVTNHVTGNVYALLRAPPKSGSGATLDTSVVVPSILLLASSDAATALIDPSLPRTIAIAATTAAVIGALANNWFFPLINKLPQRTADAVALRQELLAQYENLQARIQELTQGAAEEVRILARLCQLQNKMEAVKEQTYSARLERVYKVREGLDERLTSRLELIDSYAKVSSMIEIEVEMELDVLAAEGAAVASIAAQLEQLEEAENLQKAVAALCVCYTEPSSLMGILRREKSQAGGFFKFVIEKQFVCVSSVDAFH